jgi:hypothetical protein
VDAVLVVLEKTGRVVQDVAIDLAQRHDQLDSVSERMIGADHVDQQKRQRPPEERRDGFHPDQEGVGCEIPRVRERIFLPELSEQVLRWAHALVVPREVAFEEEMDTATCKVFSL